MENLKNHAKLLTKTAGVYLFKDGSGEVLYVGKSINVKDRVFTHLAAKGDKSKSLIAASSRIEAIPVSSELEALLLEASLIKKHLPKFNSRAKDDKHPLYIKINIKDTFPKIITSRAEDDKKSLYFGPFPSSPIVKRVLKQIRKVFPFCSQKQLGKRGCLYSHIGLCNPCPPEIIKVKDENVKAGLKKRYKKNIKQIVDLLSGKQGLIKKQLERQMQEAVKNENFEEAAKTRDQINELMYITQPYKNPNEYLENPNLVEDTRYEELNQLYKILKTHFNNLKFPKRIECFDVSHTGGSSNVSSMVSFIDGVPDKNYYRHFKIINGKTSDDYSMMKETLDRRLKHTDDWGLPDLLVVDGGKSQTKAAKEMLEANNLSIPAIGLAKRLETIVIPKKQGYTIIHLGIGTPALKVLQRIRDEAHRFARKYHFKLRLKSLGLETKSRYN